jgi:hypothetical protein
MIFDCVYFREMLKLMRTKEYEGYMTWKEAHVAVGLPHCYSRIASVPVYSDDIVAVLKSGNYETIYFLRNGYDTN